MQETDFEKWREIVEKLEKGGMTKNPYAYKVCKQCWEGNYRPLQRLLRRRPSLIRRAERNIAEIEEAHEENPYRFEHRKYDLDSLKGDIPFGRIIPYGQKVGIVIMNLTGHIGIYARSGTGKTTLMRMLIRELHRLGLPLMIFDVKGDYLDMFRDDPEVLVFLKKHMMYSHFEVHEPKSQENIDESMRMDVKVLADALYLGPTGIPIIEDAVEELFQEKGVYEGSNRWPTFEDVLLKIRSRRLRGGPKINDVLGAFEARFRPFIRSSVFNQERGIPLSLYRNHTVIIDLSGMDEAERPVLANGLVMKFYRNHLMNNLRGNQPRQVFFYDEGYHYHDAELTDNYQFFPGTSAGKVLFRMGREFGLCFIVSGTQVSAISQYVRENTSTVIAFKTQDASLKLLQENMGLTDDQKQYFYRLASKFEGVIRLPDFEHPILFNMEIKSFPKKDATPFDIDKHMKPIIDPLYAQLRRKEKFEPKPIDLNQIEQQANNQKVGVLILRKLKDNPFLHYTQLMTLIKNEYGFSKENVDSALKWLEKDQELIITKKARNSKTRDSFHYPLTLQAQVSLGIPESQRIAPSRFKHTLYCARIHSFLMSEGHEAILEYTEGEPKTTFITKSGKELTIPKRIDVMSFQNGKMVAFEIVLSFSNIAQTIWKCLKLFKVDELHIVCERKAPELDKAMKIVSEKVPGHLFERITWDTMTRFF